MFYLNSPKKNCTHNYGIKLKDYFSCGILKTYSYFFFLSTKIVVVELHKVICPDHVSLTTVKGILKVVIRRSPNAKLAMNKFVIV